MNAPGTELGSVERKFGAALHSLGSAQKTAKGAPAYSRFVNRRAGRVLAALAFVTGLTPNQVTAISAIFSFTGIAFIALVAPSPISAAAVCLALLVGYALDSADGQLARLRGGGSTSGEWLDHIIDAAKISSLHAAVLVCWYRFFDLEHDAYLLIPLGFQVVAAVMFFGMILNEQLGRQRRTVGGPPDQVTRPPSTLRSVLVVPTDYGVLCLLFGALAIERVFFAGYTLLLAANLVFLLAALVKWFGDMVSLDRTATPTEARALANQGG